MTNPGKGIKIPKKEYMDWLGLHTARGVALNRLKPMLATMTRAEFKVYFIKHFMKATEDHYKSLDNAEKKSKNGTVLWRANTTNRLCELQRWCKDGAHRVSLSVRSHKSAKMLEAEHGVFLFECPPGKNGWSNKIARIAKKAMDEGYGSEAFEEIQEGIKMAKKKKRVDRTFRQDDRALALATCGRGTTGKDANE